MSATRILGKKTIYGWTLNVVNLRDFTRVEFIEIDIGIAIEIEKHCNGNAFDSDFDSDFDPDSAVPRSIEA